MAHMISETDKQQGLAQAWHGLTEIFAGLSLKDNWLRTWEIISVPLWMRLSDLQNLGIAAADHRQIASMQLVGSDNGIAIGKPFEESYRQLTNVEFLGMLEAAMAGTQHKLTSIGTVRNRGRRFASFELVRLGSYTAGGRKFDPFLNAGDGLDKSSELWWNTSATCTVCDNTFSMNLDDVRQSLRHTKNIMVRVPDMAAKIDAAVGVHYEFATAFEALATQPVSHEAAQRIYTGFVAPAGTEKLSTRSLNTVDELVNLFQGGRGNVGQSRADLFSGATDYYTHANSGKTGANRLARQFDSSEFGSGADRKADFWKLVNSDEDMAAAEERGLVLLKKSA